MRSIRILLPLRPWGFQSRLLLTLLHQLRNRASSIVPILIDLSPILPHLFTKFRGSTLVDAVIVGVDDDAVVAGGARGRDEAAVDFLCDDSGGARERVAETAATPGYPFEDVACGYVSILIGNRVKGENKVLLTGIYVQVILLRLAQLDVVFLSVCPVTIVAVKYLARPASRHTAIHAPRLDHPAVVVYAHVAFAQPAV
jgi:hypothetical protein